MQENEWKNKFILITSVHTLIIHNLFNRKIIWYSRITGKNVWKETEMNLHNPQMLWSVLENAQNFFYIKPLSLNNYEIFQHIFTC